MLTFKVVREFFMYSFVQLQCFFIVLHSSEARGNHEPPLDFFGIDLGSSFEVLAGSFIHALLDVVNSKPSDSFNIDRQQSVAFVVVVESLGQ